MYSQLTYVATHNELAMLIVYCVVLGGLSKSPKLVLPNVVQAVLSPT